MAENTAIEWADHTFNPWEGCQKVGPGCDHRYAETRNARFGGGTAPNWGPGAPRRLTSTANWRKPLAWNRQAEADGRRYRVFCASLADVFDNAVSDVWRARLAILIGQTPHLDWLLLTKRAGNVTDMLYDMFPEDVPKNVSVGFTIVNQEEWDRDAKKIAAVAVIVGRARIFLSMEPLLGMVNLSSIERFRRWWVFVGWVIVGGESGLGARPMHPDWARSLRDQCAAAGVPFLFKQWGEWAPHRTRAAVRPEDSGQLRRFTIAASTCRKEVGATVYYAMPRDITDRGIIDVERLKCVGKKAAGRLLDGVQHDGVPL